MRKFFEIQGRFDCPFIVEVSLNHNCRDEIIPILESLKYIYSQTDLCTTIMDSIAQDVNKTSSSRRGRPGMDYWQILVLSAVRLGCNLDYDKLQDLAEQHRALRQIMGVGDWNPDNQFDWRRINDNIHKVQPDTIREISQWIAEAGHLLVPEAPKAVRGDSFVVPTNIHYPTDSSLIGDGLRKLLEIAPTLAKLVHEGGWRQYKHLQKKCKKILCKLNKITTAKGKHYQAKLKGAYKSLLRFAQHIMEKSLVLKSAVERYLQNHFLPLSDAEELHAQLDYYISATERVCDQARRRVLKGETIPPEEKLFSLFEPHTELIHRGKTPNPIEFGHRVFIVEDAAGFICHHKVMENGEQDQDVLIPEMKKLQDRLGGAIERASFDRGFHSPQNQTELQEILAHPCIAAKGKHKEEEQKRQATIQFRRARKNHPGVESAIGALQSGNGLERCRDRSYLGYQRYVALGVLGRNLHVLGKILIAQANAEARAGISKRLPIAV